LCASSEPQRNTANKGDGKIFYTEQAKKTETEEKTTRSKLWNSILASLFSFFPLCEEKKPCRIFQMLHTDYVRRDFSHRANEENRDREKDNPFQTLEFDPGFFVLFLSSV
jgi:hypothetical protein